MMDTLNLKNIANDAFRITAQGTERIMGLGGPTISSGFDVSAGPGFGSGPT